MLVTWFVIISAIKPKSSNKSSSDILQWSFSYSDPDHLGLVTKEVPPWLGAKCQKILKIRPPRLAKNAFAQCYIKLSFIAEIR